MSTPKSVLELAKKSSAKMVDIKFVDTFGTWQHFTCPIRELTEEVFSEGFGFDGSSIRGWKSIEASDMLAMPDPDTAFIDFSIPTLTSFEVSSGTTVLTEVAQTATVGDYQYRKAALTDGSTATTTWRIAVSVPNPGRAWCPPTWFPLAIIDVSGGQPSRSAPLPVTLVFGKCVSDTGVFWYSTGTTGTPAAASPPTPAGDCPGGAFAKKFEVCQSCGGSGLSSPRTFWGCSLTDARQKMETPGCTSTLRSGINCP